MSRTSKRPFVRVIYGATGLGLQKDAQLIQALLEKNGCEVECVVLPFRPRLARVLYYWERMKSKLPDFLARVLHRLPLSAAALTLKRADLQVHLQNPSLGYLGSGKVNWLIPNQEWARMDQLHYLRFVDLILCKTRTAESTYQNYSAFVRWVGFSSRFCEQMPEISPDSTRHRHFLHVGGNTLYKGTGAVVTAWRRNPQWPILELVVSDPDKFGALPANVRVWQRIDEASLLNLRKQCGVVLAPSEVEGFGHVLLEGMAWGAVVVTTDAPPMNELVTSERGELVQWVSRAPVRLGTRYCVSPEGIETAVEKVLALSDAQLTDLGSRARAWVDENHQRFVRDFERLLRDQL